MSRVWAVIFFVALMARPGGLACAEEPKPKCFRFGGGESVTILTGESQGNIQQLVSLDGFVSSPAFGTVNLLGKTILEATDALGQAIREKTGRKEPEVAILIHSIPPDREEVRVIYVLGEVKSPRAIQLPFERRYRLASCLSEVGGPTDNADLSRVKVLREKDDRIEVQVVDCTTFTQGGREHLGPELLGGDVVMVERAEAVTVAGEVQRPGVINRQMANQVPGAPFCLSRALLAAGGVKASGDKKHIRLIRFGNDGERVVNTYAFVDGMIANDPALKNGDHIEVPYGEGIMLMGGVSSPGIYYDLGGPPLTLSRLVALAGGPTAKAKTGSVLVIRRKNPGAPQTVDLRGVIEEGKLSADVRLEPGDMVFVPTSAF
jgi:protein involved in polysaccharide export with SLBB domain